MRPSSGKDGRDPRKSVSTGAVGILHFFFRWRKSAIFSSRSLGCCWKGGWPPEGARSCRIENGRPRYGEEINGALTLVQENRAGYAASPLQQRACYLGPGKLWNACGGRAQIHRVPAGDWEIDTGGRPPAAGTKVVHKWRAGGPADEIAEQRVFPPALGKTVCASRYVRTPVRPRPGR